MTAFTDSHGFNKGQAAFGALADTNFGWLQVTLDFAKIKAARLAAGATALAAADTLQVLQVPAGSLIIAGGLSVKTAEATNTTATLDLGCTGGSPIAANALGNDVATNSVAATSTGLAAPVQFTSADTLDILLNTAVPVDAVVVVWAFVVNADPLTY